MTSVINRGRIVLCDNDISYFYSSWFLTSEHHHKLSSARIERPNMTTPPQLPNEVLFHIIDLVDPADVLDLRLVCGMFRSHIDTGLAYDYLRDAELLCCLRPEDEVGPEPEFSNYEFISFKFVTVRHEEHGSVDDGVVEEDNGYPGSHGSTALFRLQEPWQGALMDAWKGKTTAKTLYWERMIDATGCMLDYLQPAKWCIKIGNEVIDIGKYGGRTKCLINLEVIKLYKNDTKIDYMESPRPASAGYVHNRLQCSGITVKIKDRRNMIRVCLQEVRALHCLYEEKKNSQYSYSLKEDCMRHIRRKICIRRMSAEYRSGWDCRAKPGVCLMRNLWGEEGSSKFLGRNKEKDEDEAIGVVLKLLEVGR